MHNIELPEFLRDQKELSTLDKEILDFKGEFIDSSLSVESLDLKKKTNFGEMTNFEKACFTLMHEKQTFGKSSEARILHNYLHGIIRYRLPEIKGFNKYFIATGFKIIAGDNQLYSVTNVSSHGILD